MLTTKKLNTDLCVIGGGLAGICAAISAAREGISVVLVHERPVLGGNSSSEIRMWVCGAHGEDNKETGIIEEIMLENLYRNPTKNHFLWDKILYDFINREKNITLLLNCTCMDADYTLGDYKNNRDRKINSVKAYQMTTQCFFEINASFFADCSGDSILAPLTGAEFRIGRESADEFGEDVSTKTPDLMTMGSSCLLQGRETEKEVPFKASEFAFPINDDHVKNRPMDIYNPSENFWYLELGGDRDTIEDAEEIRADLIPLAEGVWDYIKNSGKYDSKNWELEFLGFLPGKRESRRMVGEYIITQTDISEGKRYPDTIAYGGWPLDDHFPAGYFHKGYPNTDFVTPAPYPLPYRALYSKNVENLFFAGRNISMTHGAMSSIRVMATCGLLGQAIGSAAAVATKYNTTPQGVYENHISELQEILLNADCFLPHFKRKISKNCHEDILSNGADRKHSLYKNENNFCRRIKNNEKITYKLNGIISSVHIVFDSDLNRETLPGDNCERHHGTRANIRLDSPVMHMPKTLCKSFTLTGIKNGEKIVILKNDTNIKRCYHVENLKGYSEISLTVHENWGNTDTTNIISFDYN